MENKIEQILNTAKMVGNQSETKRQIQKEMIRKSIDYSKPLNYKLGSPSSPTWNSEADAFKHAFMSAILSKRYSIPVSNLIGTGHEVENLRKHAPITESIMDLWNNRVGRSIWKEVRKDLKGYENSFNDKFIEDYTAKKVVEKMREGKLITSPDNIRIFDKHPHINKFIENIQGVSTGGAAPINDGNTFFATEDIAKMSTDEFLAAEDIINNQIKNKIAIPKSQANRGVSSGAYIYVSEYTRDDGTKVSGYYRRR